MFIAYDRHGHERAGARLLRRVAKACTSCGVRVQKSVFEMQLGQKEWVELAARLLDEIDPRRIRCACISSINSKTIEHYG